MYGTLARVFLLLALLVASVLAQQITTTDALGQTVVEVITVDPQLGVPVTQTLQTLSASLVVSSSTEANGVVTVSTVSTAPGVQQGPVGQPPPTLGGGGPIVYTYTTTDAAGATVAIEDTFTPTTPLSTPFTPTASGTILDYSQWLTMVGTNTVDPQLGAAQRLGLGQSWIGFTSAALAGVLGGAWLVFA